MGTTGSKTGEGKLKPDNISTVSMALEAATNSGSSSSNSSQPPTKPSRGNSSSVRQQQPNGAAGYPPPLPPPSSAQVYTNNSKSINSKTTSSVQSTSVPLNGGINSLSTTKPSRGPGVMDFNGNHFYQPASKHSLGKASTTSSNYHRHYYTGDDTNNNNNSIYQHDNNNNTNTFKSVTSVKVDIDGQQQPLRKTVARNHSPTSGGGSGGRGQSRLSQYSALTDSKSEVEEKEKEKEKKKVKMAKTGRKSGSVLVVFLLELVSLVGLALLAYFLRFTEKFAVIEQNYNCNNYKLQESKDGPPFKDSIVFGSLKNTEYYLIFGLGPILMIFLFEIARSIIIYSLSHNSSSDTVHQKKLGIPIPLLIRRTVRIIGGFLFGILLTTILVDVIKVQTGNLRPYFGTLCKHLIDYCSGGHSGEPLNATRIVELCNDTKSEDIREARLSFPSVSSAMAAYSAIFLILYFSFALPFRALRFVRLWLTLGLLAVLFFTLNAGLSTFQHHLQDLIVGGLIGLLFALYAVFIHLNAFANRLSVSNPFSAKRAGEENVANKSNIEGGQLSSTLTDPFDETGSLSNRGSGSAGGLFGGGNGENDKDWFWKNFHIPRVRQSARNMWRRSENYFSGRGRGGGGVSRGANTSPRAAGAQTTTTATTNLSRHTSNAYINPAFNGGGGGGGGGRFNGDDHILANHLHQETRFGGGNGNGNGALGAASTANLHHPGANHRASSTLRTFQATSNA